MYVNVNKQDTHIYFDYLEAGEITVGAEKDVVSEGIELYDKSLVLTSDIKRLPHLLGGSLKAFYDSSLIDDLIASGLTGIDITVVLMNGDYSGIFIGGTNDYVPDLLEVPSRRKDVLMVSHKIFSLNAANNVIIFQEDNDFWDFEGEVILMDTITLVIFANAGSAVSSVALASYAWAESILEIDWKPISNKDLQDYVMEHVFARQGSESG